VTNVWEAVGGVRAAPLRRSRFSRRHALAAAAFAGALLGLWLLRPAQPVSQTYATEIGEQRRIALSDGSLAILDTDSAVRVMFGDRQRYIEHLRGRAHFEVAHDAAHPFIVRAGARQVVALGTSFDVQHAGEILSVVLMNGHVVIRPGGAAPQAGRIDLTAPGEQVVMAGEEVIHKSRLNLPAATAWQSGRAIFDDEPLSRVIAEANRYSRRHLVVMDDATAGLRVSGTYNMGDTEAFATSLSALLPLIAVYEPTRIVLLPAKR
jgi:transmembrane sensor